MSSLSRHSSLERNRSVNGFCDSTEDVYRQRLDDAYYLRRMRDILQDGSQPRPVFPCHITQLSGCLFIGNQKNAENLEELMAQGITHVVNCAPSRRRASCSESPYPLETGIIGFKVIPAEDKEDYEIMKHFDDTFNYLERVKQIKGIALVHCNMGVNRSGAIAAAYLMVSEHRYLLQIITYLKEKRNIILTNRGFRRQLIRYARSKQLLDPISNDYYIRRSGDFERLPLAEQQHAFSTPQLRRCTVEQKPPRGRNRNGRNRPLNTDSHDSSIDDQDYLVKSLPRNIARSRDSDMGQKWQDSMTNSSPMTRRSISYIVKDLDSFDNEYDRRTRARSYHSTNSRKSIAVDHFTLSQQTYRDTEQRHDDIPRLKISNLGKQFSSRYNLTIIHPSDQEKDDKSKASFLHQENLHYQPVTTKESSHSVAVTQETINASKSRYCKQIRQHFSGLISLIRPNVSKNNTSSHISTPSSNQLIFALPLQKSESKIISVVGELLANPNLGRQDPNNGDGSTSYVSTNRIAMSAPHSPLHNTNNRERAGDVRSFQQFSTQFKNIIRLRNEPVEQPRQPSGGSLVLIGTRTTSTQPMPPTPNYPANQNLSVNHQSTIVPRRLRRYIRSKTDIELL